MKRILASFLILGLVVFLTPGTPSAQIQFLNDWTLDIDGPGGFDPVTIDEFLDTVGPSYVVNSFTTTPPAPGDLGTFDDFSVFSSVQHDFGKLFPRFLDNELTGIFQGSGTVELGGPLGFTGGTLSIYADLGITVAFATDTADADPSIYGANEQILIAAFEVESGDGVVDPTGVPNGKITVIFKATFLAPGVWVDSNGTDLSTMTSSVRGFSTTNASFVENPTPAMITDLAGEFAGVSVPPSNTPPGDLFTSSNGQFRLFVEEEEEPGECRMTGGNVTVGWDYIPGTYAEVKKNLLQGQKKFYTVGGQVGAPHANGPSFGEWTHTQHAGFEGSFTFHAGTNSAPEETEISSIACDDPGWCVQARCAPFKQIFWDGIGSFKNKKGFNAVFTCNVTPGETLHYFRAHVGDFGEPGNSGKQKNEARCEWASGGPDIGDIVFIDAVPDDKFGDKGGQECDECPDYYEIEIHCTIDPTSPVIYSVGDFIDGGNFQIHPEVGQQCPY